MHLLTFIKNRVEMNLIVDTEEKLKTFQQQQYQSSRSEPAASVTSYYVKTAGVQWWNITLYVDLFYTSWRAEVFSH